MGWKAARNYGLVRTRQCRTLRCQGLQSCELHLLIVDSGLGMDHVVIIRLDWTVGHLGDVVDNDACDAVHWTVISQASPSWAVYGVRGLFQ